MPHELDRAHVDRAVLRRGLAVLGMGIREEPTVFAASVVGSAVYGGMTVASAWVLGRVVDSVVVPSFRSGHASTGALVAAFAAIVGVSLAKAAGIVGRRLGAASMQFRLQARYRRRVTRQYLRLPLSWHHRHPTGQLLSNANADVEAVWYPIAPMPMALGVAVMLVVAGVSMILTDAVLAAVAFLVFPAIFGLNVAYQRRLSPRATRAQRLRAKVSEVAHESFDGALVVKTLGREAEETTRFARAADELRDAQIDVGRVRGTFDPVLEALPNLGVLAVLLVGSARIESGALQAGELIQVAYLFTLLAFPVRAIGWVLGELPRSVVGWERVRAVLRARGGLRYGDAILEDGAGGAGVDVAGVRFAYESAGVNEMDAAATADAPGRRAVDPSRTDAGRTSGEASLVEVLHDVTFRVRPGSVVAVVGPTGSGKSTLTTLLARLVDPASGEVRLDGADLRDVRPGGVAGAVALVPQSTFLFDDTVRANITLGGDFEDDAVWQALRVAQADGFIAALPHGLDTRIGERGTTLSGGQRQRLALARAVVRRPRLLVMDDATSAVDPTVEAAILAGLRDSALPSTVVVIAYRKATIALADEVVYLEQGRVLDRGPHDELVERSAGYRRLVTAYEQAGDHRKNDDSAPEPFGSENSDPHALDPEAVQA